MSHTSPPRVLAVRGGGAWGTVLATLPADIEAGHLTAEGIPEALAVQDRSLETGPDLPISSEVCRVVCKG